MFPKQKAVSLGKGNNLDAGRQTWGNGGGWLSTGDPQSLDPGYALPGAGVEPTDLSSPPLLGCMIVLWRCTERENVQLVGLTEQHDWCFAIERKGSVPSPLTSVKLNL